jgi:2,5-furandicarboxylate decarboxylase 1
MAQDLQSFIDFLEKHHPEEVLRVKREVDPVYEATAILWRLEQERRFPLVIFENIKGSSLPCVTNLHASFPRLAMAIGLPIDATPRDFVLEYMKREDRPIPPEVVDTGPVKEVILTGDDVDVTKLPILKYHELDSGQVDPGFEAFRGRYITLGYDTMKDPDTGVANVGIYRLQVKSRNKFGIQISETAHGHYIMRKNIKRGQPTPIAVFTGVHPAVELGCLSFTGIDVDEFTIAGAMLGEPLQLVRCETIDLEVPAWAESSWSARSTPPSVSPRRRSASTRAPTGPSAITRWCTSRP